MCEIEFGFKNYQDMIAFAAQNGVTEAFAFLSNHIISNQPEFTPQLLESLMRAYLRFN